jgi:hypothetical protein
MVSRKPNASHTRTWDHSRLILSSRIYSSTSFLLRVPELGALTRSSKSIRKLAVRDDLWAPHLQFLLKVLFDDTFGDCDHEFRAWYQECHGAGNSILVKKYSVNGCTLKNVTAFEEHPNYYEGEESRFIWLLENVSHREYYK